MLEKTSRENLQRYINIARRRTLVRNLIWAFLIIAPFIIFAAATRVIAGQFVPDSRMLSAIQLFSVSIAILVTLYFALKGLTSEELALEIDRKAGLKDRVSSALEFSKQPALTPFMKAQLVDARNHARNVNYKAAFKIWPDKGSKLLGLALAIIPLLVVGLTVDFAGILAGRQSDRAMQLPLSPVPDDFAKAPDLASAKAPEKFAPFVEPVKDFLKEWKKNIETLKQQQTKSAAKLEEQVRPQAVYADKAGASNRKLISEIKDMAYAAPDNVMHLSDLQTMGVYEDLGEYTDAFKELDQIMFENEPEMENVEEVKAEFEKAAVNQAMTAAATSIGSAMAMGSKAENDDYGAFRNASQSAQQQSFSEFLSRYSQHLGKVVDTKKKLSKKEKLRMKMGKKPRMQMSSAPPPENAKVKMVKLDENMRKQVQLAPLDMSKQQDVTAKKLGSAPTTSKAGSGGGTAQGSIKTAKVEKSSQSISEVKGMMGEGKSSIQVLEDIDSVAQEDFSLEAYSMIYNDFAVNESDILESNQIPVDVKSYVRAYYMSINPDKLGKGK